MRAHRGLALGAALLAAAALLPSAPAASQNAASRNAGAPQSAQQRQSGGASDSHGFVSATRFGQRDGAALYAAICAGCHMPDGRGAIGAGAYPALAGNSRLEASAYPVHVVLHGQGGMPGFATQLDDRQVAAVVDWVRGNLGNDYGADPTRPEDVLAARQ